jgi:hypothetical protein
MPVKFSRTGIPALDRILQEVVALLNRLEQQVMKRDRPVEVTFANAFTDTQVAHGLGGVPAGWVAIYKSQDVDVWNGSDAANPSKYLNLQVSGPATIRFIFY